MIKLNRTIVIVIVIVLLVLVLAGIGAIAYKKIKHKLSDKIDYAVLVQLEKLENVVNKGTSSAVEDVLFRVDALTRQNDSLMKAAISAISKAPLDAENIQQLDELCNTQIESSYDNSGFAEGNHCLAKLYLKLEAENAIKDDVNLIKSIQNASSALEFEYRPDYASTLYSAIAYGYENVIPKELLKQSDSITANSSEEVALLNKLISLNIPKVSSRAYYRLSHINQNGRSSVAENTKKVDYFEALKNRKLSRTGLEIKTTNNVDVALVFDDYYSPHSATAIASILFNSLPDTYHTFYIIEDPKNPISEENKQKLSSLKYIKDYSINFVTFPDELLSNIDINKYSSSHFPKLSVYRIFLSKFLNLPRILYIDGDLVVNRDLSRLFNTRNMENYFFAGALDGVPYHCSKQRHECIHSMFYINAGVMLLNLDNMRKYDLSNMITNRLKELTCQIWYFDQDFINFTFEDKIKFISRKWNTSDPFFIKHYCSASKPWRWPGNTKDDEVISLDKWKKDPESFPGYFRLYWYYRDLTPWTTNPDKLDSYLK